MEPGTWESPTLAVTFPSCSLRFAAGSYFTRMMARRIPRALTKALGVVFCQLGTLATIVASYEANFASEVETTCSLPLAP